MSATEFIDRALADSGEYAVYGKHLGDKMRADVQYGPDPVKPPRPLYSVYAMNPNRARIAEIDRELDELQAQLASYDMEDEIGQYKFLYDNDPSVLTNYQNQKRTEQMNAKMRNATEAATKASNLQSAWKQNGIDLEVAKYDVLAAQQAYDEIKGTSDSEGIKRTETELERAKARYNRVSHENKMLKSQMMQSLGVLEDDEAELEDEAGKILANINEGKGNNENTPNVPNVNNDVANAEAIQKLDGELTRLDNTIVVDNIPINKKEKIQKIQEWNKMLSEAKSKINNSNLSTVQKNERLDKITVLENKVRTFAKPANKGGQSEIVVKDKEYYQKILDGLTRSGLEEKGLKWLKDARDAGATHKYLNNAIERLGGK